MSDSLKRYKRDILYHKMDRLVKKIRKGLRERLSFVNFFGSKAQRTFFKAKENTGEHYP